ncbi:SdiA-regulated domain-containing protein [Stutzerimonas stutzeri]|uniref:SdiA-regulated domain-containing protein n=1 Tax=Stutzerimonas stutzeri TaxID=316 RepID=UPI000F7A5551|nr:SdiA-regulated domain-containing protein [Stutzerimonas stutzeri]MDH0497364.1 SdiA-regulated domain-containing protein [Stutzerimonas stutzeri]RRW08665.1 DNA-binding protein [Stutzerimonas stutzeri]WGG17182.1 SdiA-regulated domain-containing protein [Stutzerimonas stutzeri]
MRALKILLAALLGVALLLAVAAGVHYRLFERGWFHFTQWQQGEQSGSASLWLPDYRATVQAKPIEGLSSDVSALTFDPDRRTLFTVTNKKPEVVELSLDGEIIRRVPLIGFGDPEAIEYISRDLYVITDERQQRLFRVHLDDDTDFVDAADSEQLSLGIGLNGNKGFEGLAYDPVNHRLFAAKERDPVTIYEIHGFPHTHPDKPFAVHVVEDPERDARLFVRDLSSLQYDQNSGHLLALSDESRLVLEINSDGRPISTLSLLGGRNGLEKGVPQAEGVALDDHGRLYLVSEPNLFYVFEKQAQP